MKVYMLVGQMKGPPSHGEPGATHLTILQGGSWYAPGRPLPCFMSREGAERYWATRPDRFGSWKPEILELDVMPE